MALCVRLSTVARAAIASSGSIGFLQSRLTGLKSIASCNHVDNCFGLVGYIFFSFCLNMVSLRTRLKASDNFWASWLVSAKAGGCVEV